MLSRYLTLSVSCIALLVACQPQVVYVPATPAPPAQQAAPVPAQPQPQAPTPAPAQPQPQRFLRKGQTTKAAVERKFGRPKVVLGDIDDTYWFYMFEDSEEVYILHFLKGLYNGHHQSTRSEFDELMRQEEQKDRQQQHRRY